MEPVVPIPVELESAGVHDVILIPLARGGYEIRTTGSDPYLFTKPLATTPNVTQHRILSFSFFCASGLDSMQVFFGPAISEDRSLKGPGPGVSEGWTEYTIDLSKSPRWEGVVESLRLDFGNHSGKVIRIRDIVLRSPSARELEIIARREALRDEELRHAARAEAYLEKTFPSHITRVAVSPEAVSVSVDLGDVAPQDVYVCAVPLFQDVTGILEPAFSTPVASTVAEFEVPRFQQTGERRHDHLLSKWFVARRSAAGWTLLSQAHYADDDAITGSRTLPVPAPRSRKGIGGFGAERFDHGSDADALGIGYVTVNIMISFMQPGPGEHAMPFEYCGKTYYADRGMIEGYDRTMRFCAERGIVVSGIILIPKAEGFGGDLGRIFMHPDCDPKGIFTMANLTSAEGLEYYAAALDFLAERYSREDGEFGRVHHWIVHNEVDAGWVWTNAGDKPLSLYMELYHNSMRVAHLIARSYDPGAKAFVSLTHQWVWSYDSHFYGSKAVLETLTACSAAGGDFDWGIAFHPYPESLRNPRCWEDTKVDFTFDTPLITFKNIEVLGAWVEQPSMQYRGSRRRTVHLSEQGPNSPDYSEASLTDQAACMAYAWQKLKVIDAIEAFQYHNWIDNRHEGGLRIGLRKFPDGEFKGEAKPIWFVFQKLDTPEEDEACEFAKDVIGVQDWDEARFEGEIK